MKNEDNYLSSCTLFNVKMNILTELRGVSSMLKIHPPKLNPTPIIYRQKFPKN